MYQLKSTHTNGLIKTAPYIYITNKDKITTGKFMTFNVHFVFLQGYIWVIYCLF